MKFTESIFKAYDIRGKVGSELTPEVVMAVGRSLADLLPAGDVAVGRDMRPDSAELSQAMIEGLTKQGRNVIDLGEITSDMMYFAVGNYDYAGGAMITASHNPGEYNGIKLTAKGVAPIGEETGLLTIKEAIINDSIKPSDTRGSVLKKNILGDWIDHALKFAPHLKPLRVGIDAGNGMAGIDVSGLREKTPLEISGLYLNPDGSFPNHPANPLEFENLRDLIELVKRERLDCGIAFDGDGDRAFMVDENGEVVSGSVLGTLLAGYFLDTSPGATVLYNAITSRIAAETITKKGGKAIRTKVGHSFIKADMRKYGAVFACEHSGHYYFRDNYNADSGLIATLCALNIMSVTGKKLSELCAPLRASYNDSGEINFKVKDVSAAMQDVAAGYTDGERDDLDGMTINYPDWWFNLRPSNTEPLLRLNIEANSQSDIDQNLGKISKILEKHIDG